MLFDPDAVEAALIERAKAKPNGKTVKGVDRD